MNFNMAGFFLIALFSCALVLPSNAQVVAILHGSGLHNFDQPYTLTFLDLAADQKLLSVECPKGIASSSLFERKSDLLLASGWDDNKRKVQVTTLTLFSLEDHVFSHTYSQDTLYFPTHLDVQNNVLYLQDWGKESFELDLNREQWLIEKSETPLAQMAAPIDQEHWVWAKENQLMMSSDALGSNSIGIYTHPHLISSLSVSKQTSERFVAFIADTQSKLSTLLFSSSTLTLEREIPLQEGESLIHLSSDRNTYYTLKTEYDISNQDPRFKIFEDNLENDNRRELYTFTLMPSIQTVYPVRYTRNHRFILLGLGYSKESQPSQLFLFDLLTYESKVKDIGPGRIHSILELSEDAIHVFKTPRLFNGEGIEQGVEGEK